MRRRRKKLKLKFKHDDVVCGRVYGCFCVYRVLGPSYILINGFSGKQLVGDCVGAIDEIPNANVEIMTDKLKLELL